MFDILSQTAVSFLEAKTAVSSSCTNHFARKAESLIAQVLAVAAKAPHHSVSIATIILPRFISSLISLALLTAQPPLEHGTTRRLLDGIAALMLWIVQLRQER